MRLLNSMLLLRLSVILFEWTLVCRYFRICLVGPNILQFSVHFSLLLLEFLTQVSMKRKRVDERRFMVHGREEKLRFYLNSWRILVSFKKIVSFDYNKSRQTGVFVVFILCVIPVILKGNKFVLFVQVVNSRLIKISD